MKNHNLDFTRSYPLGFTFSFPCYQAGLSRATLLRWTKGFNCSETVGENVVELLQKAIDARGDINVKVIVLINDTVGTLMSCAYQDNKTAIGLILGTGTNACYIESMDRIETVEDFQVESDYKEMIINTEWGAFGENGSIDFIRSRYDDEIDKTSINVGKQMYIYIYIYINLNYMK
jgi:hexokinase